MKATNITASRDKVYLTFEDDGVIRELHIPNTLLVRANREIGKALHSAVFPGKFQSGQEMLDRLVP